MRKLMKVVLAAGAGAFTIGWVGLSTTMAADLAYPQGQYEGPPPQAYGPPPVEENYAYPPPPAVPPPAYYYQYGPPPYVAAPIPYSESGPYWRGYPPHYARGYGRWDHRRW